MSEPEKGDRSRQRKSRKQGPDDLKENSDGEMLKGVWIRDRYVYYVPYDDGSKKWGDGPGYLIEPSKGRWYTDFSYRKVAIETTLSHRGFSIEEPLLISPEMVAKGLLLPHSDNPSDWRPLFDEVEFLHTKLANDSRHRAAGNQTVNWRKIRHHVIESLRSLDSTPLKQLLAAVEAVRAVKQRDYGNDLIIVAIVQAANQYRDVPLRSEVLKLLSATYSAAAFNERLKRIGFSWLPGGRARYLPG